MPLFKKIINQNFTLALWHLTEEEDQFLSNKDQFSASPEKLEEIHVPQRRKEWLCSRQLGWQIAKEIEGRCDGVWSDSHNKPHIKNSELQISISHAQPYVAVLVSRNKSCGVDVEEKKEKLKRLAPKFLTPNELNQTKESINALALAWGAKEAVYKLYGRKKLIFKENIFLHGLDNIKQNGRIKSELKVTGNVIIIEMEYEQFGNHILVYTV